MIFLLPALLLTIIFKYVPMGGIMIAFTDADWDAYISELNGYKLDRYLEIYQNYLNDFYKK